MEERSKSAPENLDGLTAIVEYYEAELNAMTRNRMRSSSMSALSQKRP